MPSSDSTPEPPIRRAALTPSLDRPRVRRIQPATSMHFSEGVQDSTTLQEFGILFSGRLPASLTLREALTLSSERAPLSTTQPEIATRSSAIILAKATPAAVATL